MYNGLTHWTGELKQTFHCQTNHLSSLSFNLHTYLDVTPDKTEALSIHDDTLKQYLGEQYGLAAWTWICSSPNNQLTHRVNPHWRQADEPAESTLQHQWRDGRMKRRDISGNRLDNRRKHWQPVPCTGTRWLAEETSSPGQERPPSAALQPQAAPAPLSRAAAAAGAWLELWRYDLGFPRSHRVDLHLQQEARGPQWSFFAAQTLVRPWQRSEVEL